MIAEVPFAYLLNLCIEDIKTSFGVLWHGIESGDVCPVPFAEPIPMPVGETMSLPYELVRATGNLNKIQHIYHMQKGTYPLHIQELVWGDCAQEQRVKSEAYLNSRGVALELAGDLYTTAYFDETLIAQLLAAVVANSIRYSHDRVQLWGGYQPADTPDTPDYFVIRVSDNGRGYPEAACAADVGTWDAAQFMGLGRLGTLIYYAACIADTHQHGTRKGRVSFSNRGPLGGGMFALYLP